MEIEDPAPEVAGAVDPAPEAPHAEQPTKAALWRDAKAKLRATAKAGSDDHLTRAASERVEAFIRNFEALGLHH